MPDKRISPEVKGATWGAFWWGLSVMAHATAVFSLIYFTPLREWFFSRPDPKELLADLSERRVSELAKVVINTHTARLREKVGDQKRILDRLSEIKDLRYDKYAKQTAYFQKRGEKVPAVEPLSVLGSPGAPAPAKLGDKDIAQLYDIAIEIEKTTIGTYRHFRTLELAMIQSIPLSEAFDATKLAVPIHAPLDNSVFGHDFLNMTDGTLDAMKKELHRVNMEVAGMVAAAQRMLDMAEEILGEDVGATIGFSTGGSGPTGGGAGDEDGKKRKAIFEGYSPPAPDAFYHSWGVGVGPVVHRKELFPQNVGAMMGQKPPMPGRKLMESDKAWYRAEWMYLDTWYLIGPFPGDNRNNLDKKFPPEDGKIDLDATYIGKDGRKVRWQFRQSATVCIFPHQPMDDAIWYAYTQVYADKDQDRWCIFGSDDYGKVWMDDELIFASGKTPHPWIPDRGVKKVHFKKGFNSILFKLENAWGNTGYSMCIYMGEDL